MNKWLDFAYDLSLGAVIASGIIGFLGADPFHVGIVGVVIVFAVIAKEESSFEKSKTEPKSDKEAKK